VSPATPGPNPGVGGAPLDICLASTSWHSLTWNGCHGGRARAGVWGGSGGLSHPATTVVRSAMQRRQPVPLCHQCGPSEATRLGARYPPETKTDLRGITAGSIGPQLRCRRGVLGRREVVAVGPPLLGIYRAGRAAPAPLARRCCRHVRAVSTRCGLLRHRRRLCRCPAIRAFGGQSMTAPPVKLISLAVIVRAQSDAAKVAMLATSS
jgi:hypothetical protein